MPNLIAYAHGANEAETRWEEYEKGEWQGEPPADVELAYAEDMLRDMTDTEFSVNITF